MPNGSEKGEVLERPDEKTLSVNLTKVPTIRFFCSANTVKITEPITPQSTSVEGDESLRSQLKSLQRKHLTSIVADQRSAVPELIHFGTITIKFILIFSVLFLTMLFSDSREVRYRVTKRSFRCIQI